MRLLMSPLIMPIYNFCAGPGVLPDTVLAECQQALVDFEGRGVSILSLSHRSEAFVQMAYQAEQDLKALLKIPDTHGVLFLTASGSEHFSMVPLNLLGAHQKALYLTSGFWSTQAFKTGQLFGRPDQLESREMREAQVLELDSQRYAYCHLTSNETIDGVQYPEFPRSEAVLVADMSSDILSRAIDVTQFGLIYAAAQKNIGPSGFSVAVIQKDLNFQVSPRTPPLYQYQNYLKYRSIMNTPNIFAWFTAGRVFQWLLKEGGVAEMARRSAQKSKLFYEFLDHSDLYDNAVPESRRSKMVVPFDLKHHLSPQCFVQEAEKAGCMGLMGHRVRGGLRAAFYNAMPLAGVEHLIGFMKDFEKKYSVRPSTLTLLREGGGDQRASTPVITIDGPSGVGKGTAARALAAHLGWHFLDSGALYRITALKAQQADVAVDQVEAIAGFARDLDVVFRLDGEKEPRVILEHQDVTDLIRTEACGSLASKIAALGPVREALLERQRGFAVSPGLVTDGRDMGTVVFPRANLKFFLTASAETRADRRFKQLQEKGVCANIASILQDIRDRDARDITRTLAPLVPAQDAVQIFTDQLSIEAVLEKMLQCVQEMKRNSPKK